MSENDVHCEALVREQDRDRFLATLFAPARHRPALHALYAFDLEISQIATRVRDPLAGEIRLQWWHDVIDGPAREQAAGHPVAAALLAVTTAYRLPVAALLAAIEARRSELETFPFETADACDDYAVQTDGSILALASDILLDGRIADTRPLLPSAAKASATARLLGLLPRHRLEGKVFVPGDFLARHGLRPNDILADASGPQVRAATAAWAARALERLSQARALLSALPDEARAALLPLALARPVLTAATGPRYDPLAPLTLPDWRRQWILWRGARNLARYL
jgi:phytoene synthase